MKHKKKLLALLAVFALFASTAADARAATHKYDALGRLVETVYDSGCKVAYSYDANGNMTAIKGGSATAAVSGKVTSFNPKAPTTIQLIQGGNVAHEIIQREEAGSGQATQSFSFENVKPGTYTLVVTKPAHAKFTVRTVNVAEGGVDLAKDSRELVRAITLLCGDVNGDGFINVNDLNEVWSAGNYNKAAGNANNPLCDLNGDGFINVNDLNIVWSLANYNKREIIVE